MIPREADFSKLESSTSDHQSKAFKPSSTSTASTSGTSWSRLKDPRIVRVSKAFGGKDRHSKVCTVRGLRDRRVRLSVPTAIQLYDLQDRLGLNQPSKVVDWLLNAAKNEIDELPPLQIPPGSFQPIMAASQMEKQRLKMGGNTVNWNDPLRSSRASIFGEKFRVSTERDESVNWERNEEESQLNVQNQDACSVPGNNFSSRENLSGLMNNSSIPYNAHVRFDPSNLSLSHPPRSHGLTQPQEDWHSFGLAPIPASTGSHHQVFVYQHGISTQSYFPSQIAATSTDQYNLKPVDFQSSQPSISSPVDSNAQPVRPIHFMNMTASLLPSQNDDLDEQRKGRI